MTKREQILKEYAKTKIVHPSYGEIARIVKVSKSYVYEVIQAYEDKKGV
jgi:transposase